MIIPTLNAAATLPTCLAAIAPDMPVGTEIIVVDGGSDDASVRLAEEGGAQLIREQRGRGRQLAAGAAAAVGEWLLFLHADTVLENGWRAAVDNFIADPVSRMRAATFRFALDDRTAAARRLERLVAWRTDRLGLPYGDQGLLIARSFYEGIGGFAPMPLMEDVDIVRRIGRTRLAQLDATARTSASRFRRDGYLRRPARNLFCLALYFLGVPPRLIASLYGR